MPVGATNSEIHDQINKLFNSIQKDQHTINSVRPADPEKKHLVENQLKEFCKMRGKPYFFNYLSSGRGNGPFTELIDGSIKYDLINGIGFNLLGHAHPIYIKAQLEAATVDTLMCGNLQAYREPNLVAKELLDVVKDSRLRHFWFSCSGSFANDTALKIIWQKKAPKYKLIALQKAFAGRSIATQDITHNESYREGMPQSIDVEHALNYDYNDPENALKKTIESLDQIWAKSPDNYCALMLELVQGEGGFIFGTKEYYRGVLDWAKSKGLYIWMDEIQTFGRTHQMFAYQTFNLDHYVDVVTIGKALQACGTFFTEELNPKPGLIAGTFVGSIASLNAGEKIVKYLKDGNFYGEKGYNKKIEHTFISRLKHMSQNSCKGKITHASGIGTMIAFEVGDSSKEATDKFIKSLFNNGIICFSAGKNPTRVRFLLPLILTDQHIDDIFKIIETTLQQVF